MFWPAYASWCSRMWVKDHFGLLFPIISFCSFKRLHFPFEHSLSQFDIWLGSRVWALLGNEGLSRKGYKMRCLQMPFFWFMNFANKIKRIRDKTFCFDVWLGPNPHTQHTSCMHGVGCNLQANGEWLNARVTQNKKKGCSYELTQQTTKGYSLCGVYLRLLAQTSPSDLFFLSSSLISLPFLVKLLPRVDLGLFIYHYLYIFLPCLHV